MFTTNGMDTLNKYFKVLAAEKFQIRYIFVSRQNRTNVL